MTFLFAGVILFVAGILWFYSSKDGNIEPIFYFLEYFNIHTIENKKEHLKSSILLSKIMIALGLLFIAINFLY